MNSKHRTRRGRVATVLTLAAAAGLSTAVIATSHAAPGGPALSPTCGNACGGSPRLLALDFPGNPGVPQQ